MMQSNDTVGYLINAIIALIIAAVVTKFLYVWLRKAPGHGDANIAYNEKFNTRMKWTVFTFTFAAVFLLIPCYYGKKVCSML